MHTASTGHIGKLAALIGSADFGGARLKLYDLDMPGSKGGTLRVYITRATDVSGRGASGIGASAASQVISEEAVANAAGLEMASEPACGPQGCPAGAYASLEDCAKVNRMLLESPLLEELFPGDYTIEVSSPGVNRKLRTVEHFQSAVGERVRLVVDGKQLGDQFILGESSLSAARVGKLALVGTVQACEKDALMLIPEPSNRKKRRERQGKHADKRTNKKTGVELVAPVALRVPLSAIGEARVDFLFS